VDGTRRGRILPLPTEGLREASPLANEKAPAATAGRVLAQRGAGEGEAGDSARESQPPRLIADGLVKSYGGRTVVRGVTIDIAPGEIVGLLGPNGAGKTTTFSIVVGLVVPDEGTVRLGDRDLTGLPMYRRARAGISYLPQEPSVFRKMTVEQNVLAILETLDLPHSAQRERADELLAEFGLEAIRDHRAYTLSGGERRRVEIARSLVVSPFFLLLDEPFAGIDPIAVLDIQSIVRRLASSGIGVLVTDHNVRETLSIVDRAYIINGGEILRSGTPLALSNDAVVRKIYLGEAFQLR
jgi:lipopolysaccharide export system ATP-binding protein